MNIKEQIRAEIERLQNLFCEYASEQIDDGETAFAYSASAVEFGDRLRCFLDSLPEQPVEIHIDNPNIQKFVPNIKVETRTDGTGDDGKAMLYVAEKSYKIGFRDGKASKEQPMEYPTSTEMIAEWENNELPMLREKDFRGDAERMAYNAFMDGFAKGLGYKEDGK